MNDLINTKKKEQRIVSAKKRKVLSKNNQDAHLSLINQILKIKAYNKAKTIASFISIRTEIFMEPLNNFIIESNKKLCLPIISKKHEYLVFREFNKKSNLKIGSYGIHEPDENNKELIPDFILTPCLAFDEFGYRIGYGGGFYDKTFNNFKKLNHSFISVAVAYEDQKVKKVIIDKYDQKIDYILTEKKIYRS